MCKERVRVKETQRFSVSDTGQSRRLLSLDHTDSGQTAKATVRITCIRSEVLVKVMMNLDLSMFTLRFP